MPIVQLEHKIRDFDQWKKAFDRDPANRKEAGVRRYRVLRPVDDANYIIVDLEFDSTSEAERFIAVMRTLWADAAATPALQRVNGKAADGPRTRIVEAIETKEFLIESEALHSHAAAASR
jgi:hypothetical protein